MAEALEATKTLPKTRHIIPITPITLITLITQFNHCFQAKGAKAHAKNAKKYSFKITINNKQQLHFDQRSSAAISPFTESIPPLA